MLQIESGYRVIYKPTVKAKVIRKVEKTEKKQATQDYKQKGCYYA